MSALILVVDDEPDVAELFRQQFRTRNALLALRDGIRAIGVGGVEARRAAEDASLILILSDINMPGMSGLELLPRARQARPDVPVIMITAYGDPKRGARRSRAAPPGCFTKPIDFPELRGRPTTSVAASAARRTRSLRRRNREGSGDHLRASP